MNACPITPAWAACVGSVCTSIAKSDAATAIAARGKHFDPTHVPLPPADRAWHLPVLVVPIVAHATPFSARAGVTNKPFRLRSRDWQDYFVALDSGAILNDLNSQVPH
jgi:hypothetical protein